MCIYQGKYVDLNPRDVDSERYGTTIYEVFYNSTDAEEQWYFMNHSSEPYSGHPYPNDNPSTHL